MKKSKEKNSEREKEVLQILVIYLFLSTGVQFNKMHNQCERTCVNTLFFYLYEHHLF